MQRCTENNRKLSFLLSFSKKYIIKIIILLLGMVDEDLNYLNNRYLNK